jgi:hypothetical protein
LKGARIAPGAADHCLDLRADQRVEDWIDLGAGDAEDVLDALRLEVGDQELRAVAVGAHFADFFGSFAASWSWKTA